MASCASLASLLLSRTEKNSAFSFGFLCQERGFGVALFGLGPTDVEVHSTSTRSSGARVDRAPACRIFGRRGAWFFVCAGGHSYGQAALGTRCRQMCRVHEMYVRAGEEPFCFRPNISTLAQRAPGAAVQILGGDLIF